MALFGQSGRGLLPPVVKFLLIANVAVYILQYFFLAGISPTIYNYFVGYSALWPVDGSIQSLLSFQPGVFLPHQLITYQFMHGDFWHLFFNMFMLWMFGRTLEGVWGSRRFLTIYTLSGIGAAFLHLGILHLMGGDPHPTVGASGSLFGILIGFAMTFPEERLIVFPIFIPIKAKYVVLGAMAMEMLSGITRSQDGIAHFAHIGGAITAFLIIKYLSDAGAIRWIDRIWPLKSIEIHSAGNPYNNQQSHHHAGHERKQAKVYNYNWFAGTKREDEPAAPSQPKPHKSYVVNGEEINQQIIDDILDKINLSGYQSLTDRERNILTELSKKL
jgi:membrane associated rhomboid family serine protease